MKRYSIEHCAIFRAKGLAGPLDVLRISRSHLQRLADQGAEAYREWDEEKSTGALRHIEAPRRDLKLVQRRLASLLMRVNPPDFLYCPVKRRDFLLNAKRHAGAKCVWTIDLKSYFETTPAGRVRQFFLHRLQCAGDLAAILTKISTMNGHLPTGSPASPILAYFANEAMWLEIEKVATAHGCIISVYMDDLTISGPKIPPDFRLAIKKVIGSFGFTGHKEEIYSSGVAKVTGGVIANGDLSLPHDFYKRRRLKRVAVRAAEADDAAVLGRSLKGMDQLHLLAAKRGNEVRAL